ncbi:hypothetical protein ACPV5R_18700 [Vibrio astriarenae]
MNNSKIDITSAQVKRFSKKGLIKQITAVELRKDIYVASVELVDGRELIMVKLDGVRREYKDLKPITDLCKASGISTYAVKVGGEL